MAKKIWNDKTYLAYIAIRIIRIINWCLKGKLSLSSLFPLHPLHQVPNDWYTTNVGIHRWPEKSVNQVQLTDIDCTFFFFFISKCFFLYSSLGNNFWKLWKRKILQFLCQQQEAPFHLKKKHRFISEKSQNSILSCHCIYFSSTLHIYTLFYEKIESQNSQNSPRDVR